jgi:methyl-accepting chemotaxis protein
MMLGDMMRFTVIKKLFAGFLAVLFLMVGISWLGYSQLSQVNTSYTQLIKGRVYKINLIKDMLLTTKEEQYQVRGFLLLPTEQQQILYKKSKDRFHQLSQELETTLDTGQMKELLKELNHQHSNYEKLGDQVIELKKQNQMDEVIQVVKTAAPIIQNINEIIQKMISIQQDLIDKGNAESTSLVASTQERLLGLSLLALAAGAFIAYFISRVISKPVLQVAQAAEQIAAGNLTMDELKIKNKDEIGDLARSFNQMTRNLRNIIQQVRLYAEQVAATSEELTASAFETTKATEQIASVIQEVAVGSEKQVESVSHATGVLLEISRGMDQVSSSIQSVADVSVSTSQKANVGSNVVVRTIDQMNVVQHTVQSTSEVVNELGSKSKEIGQIVHLITEIASQTNLLALNAAIEAARAGEHGRGFAVVADEVRKLAEQSGQAAGQISSIIEEIQQQAEKAVNSMNNGTDAVQEGLQMVNQTGEFFKEIVQMIEEISVQSQEVAAVVEEVNASAQGTVEMMESVALISQQSSENTQHVAAAAEEQNASMEEISASSEALSQMAVELQEAMQKFKL